MSIPSVVILAAITCHTPVALKTDGLALDDHHSLTLLESLALAALAFALPHEVFEC